MGTVHVGADLSTPRFFDGRVFGQPVALPGESTTLEPMSKRRWTALQRPVLALAISVGLLAGCALVPPSPDCRIGARCDAVLEAARQVVSFSDARVVVLWGRGLGFNAEVHVCYGDGRYVLVDVLGDDLGAAIRGQPWDTAPCR